MVQEEERTSLLRQALIKADFWLIFFSLMLKSGYSLTVIDTFRQMSEFLGYDNACIFVPMISIWSFLGHVGGGYFSELTVRNYAYLRPVVLAVVQVLMAVGHFLFTMAWPGTMYISTLLVAGWSWIWSSLSYHSCYSFRAVRLEKFWSLYNFITIANPAGSLIFLGVIVSTIYDIKAEKQAS